MARDRGEGREAASAVHASLAGLCASLVGIGLARFAYTPLLPALIDAGWFTPAAAAYLGAANLAGYLAGALIAQGLSLRVPAAALLRGMMLLASAAFLGCAVPLSFLWFFAWRFASGVSGGVLMVLAATTVLPHISPVRRGLASGAIFTGIGLGIAASGTLVPFLLQFGVVATWCGLGALSLLLTAVAWTGWPASGPPAGAAEIAAIAHRGAQRKLRALYVEYALNAVGLVPHMIFLVDFVARGLGLGIAAGGTYWVLFGVGAIAGPIVAGYGADLIGVVAALRLALVVELAAVAAPVLSQSPVVLAASSLVVGASVPGLVALVLGRVQQLATPAGCAAAWSIATVAFAVGQAAAAYGFSFVFARASGGYLTMFAVGATAIAMALVIDIASGERVARE